MAARVERGDQIRAGEARPDNQHAVVRADLGKRIVGQRIGDERAIAAPGLQLSGNGGFGMGRGDGDPIGVPLFA